MMHYEALEKYFKLKRVINLRAVSKLKELGLGPKQAWLLRCIGRSSPISAARLAELTASDPAAITRSVDTLVRHGWLKKLDSQTDRRAWQIYLTTEGKKIAKRIRNIQEKLAVEVFGSLSVKEQNSFLTLLDRIISRFNGITPQRKEG